MTGVVIGGLRMRKLRAVLTALAIVFGVAMISGTYVLMDTTTHAFNSVFATEYSKAGQEPDLWSRPECAVGAGCRGGPDPRVGAGARRTGVHPQSAWSCCLIKSLIVARSSAP
jgi:hypothetical protein